MKRWILFVAVMFWVVPVQAAIQSEEVSYQSGETTLKGYIAYDDAIEGKRPGVIVVHEWWGHNDYVRRRADQLAAMGYVAFAIDMYGDGKKAEHPDDAGAFAKEVFKNLDQAQERFKAALKILNHYPLSDPEKNAAIGYCFGGGTVLHMARAGVDLDGVVSFHGSIAPKVEAKPGMVKTKVLVFNGADDTMITSEQIEAFKQEMDGAGVDYTFVNLPNAKHGFTNPMADEVAEKFGMPIGYNAQADQDSWAQMSVFFDEIFNE